MNAVPLGVLYFSADSMFNDIVSTRHGVAYTQLSRVYIVFECSLTFNMLSGS